MLTVLWYTLRESIHRRMGLVLLVFSLVLPGAMLMFIRFEKQPDGSLIAHTGRLVHRNIAEFVATNFQSLLDFAVGPFVFLGVFAAGSLLTSYLERGSTDLLLSKGVSRWQFFLGRYLGALALFVVALLVMDGGTALYFWIRTGIGPGRFFLSLLYPMLSVASLLALMALVSLSQPNTGLLILVAFLQMTFAQMLFYRQEMYTVIKWQWLRSVMDWAYRILPKTVELSRDARRFLVTGNVEAWWPIWSTGVFVVVVLGASFWFLHRKSF